MDYSVGLQPVFEYLGKWLLAGLLLLAFGAVLMGMLALFHKKYKENKLPAMENFLRRLFRTILRRRHFGKVIKLERRYKNNDIELRDASQELSMELRTFVFDMTGIRAETYSRYELAEFGSPMLSDVIGYIYEPAFAVKSDMDLRDAFRRSKELIATWK